MNPNSFRFRLIAFDKVSMPVGNGQIVGFERLLFEGNVLNCLFCTAFGKQGVAFFQTTCLYPFSLTVKRVDFIGNKGLAVTDAV
ncbi:Uncharacterised protein [Neisseria meningitidis]|uniref:Uncharacterized protein n=1 Tax=Neisseria meningitidis TaxID=487 RepID=A0AB33TX53_NEIME|nr:hypothetical protein M0579_00619 [Neisseria meningitidis M0579]ANW86787.1 hypothetical protein DE8669_0377 [Neisseria meningitidis]EQD21763.1 hypothetical protein NM3230_0680 [Neisseria meningitidis NM3230]CWM36401.1 Uncharacterised protein [Neisseria meningitidis]CWM48357.1 Uncharacterised protein [Neisseria meningitidis]